jgi:hypothetical protein
MGMAGGALAVGLAFGEQRQLPSAVRDNFAADRAAGEPISCDHPQGSGPEAAQIFHQNI